jgi:hypothetical protein
MLSTFLNAEMYPAHGINTFISPIKDDWWRPDGEGFIPRLPANMDEISIIAPCGLRITKGPRPFFSP